VLFRSAEGASRTVSECASDDVSFIGYILATAAPATEDMEAEIRIDPVLAKLKEVDTQQKELARSLVRSVYADLRTEIARLEEEVMVREEEARRLEGEARRLEEEARRERERAEEARRQQEQTREEEVRRLEEEAKRLEEESRRQREQVAEAARRRVDEARRQREEAQSARARIMERLRVALAACGEKVQTFRSSMRALTGDQVNAAVVSELRRARPPNGRTLQAVVTSGGMYTSPTRGEFDLIDTFVRAVRIDGRDLPSAFNGLLQDVQRPLHAFDGLPGFLVQAQEFHFRAAQQQINAVTTRGGVIHRAIAGALFWRGGQCASDAAISYAEGQLQRSTCATLQSVADQLAGGLEQVRNRQI